MPASSRDGLQSTHLKRFHYNYVWIRSGSVISVLNDPSEVMFELQPVLTRLEVERSRRAIAAVHLNDEKLYGHRVVIFGEAMAPGCGHTTVNSADCQRLLFGAGDSRSALFYRWQEKTRFGSEKGHATQERLGGYAIRARSQGVEYISIMPSSPEPRRGRSRSGKRFPGFLPQGRIASPRRLAEPHAVGQEMPDVGRTIVGGSFEKSSDARRKRSTESSEVRPG